MELNKEFRWERYPEGENFIQNQIDRFLRNPSLKSLSEKLKTRTSTRLFDWIDHIVVKNTPENVKALEKGGFKLIPKLNFYQNRRAQFPLVVLGDQEGLAVSVESIDDYLLIHGGPKKIEGSPFSSYRRSLISNENNLSFWVVERRSWEVTEPETRDEKYLSNYFKAYETWSNRDRRDLRNAHKLAKDMVNLVGEAIAASIVCEIERKFWQSKNRAGQVQKARQDYLGLGWANHDHHTFRSSRSNFKDLVQFFEILGFHVRERFYAGKAAGWGAQVMEHDKVRLVMFLDVDLDDHEIGIDFAHETLPEKDKLGTIGLWCALHGDSIQEAGMHHLEAQFEFDDLKKDLHGYEVGMMEPFSNFEYLKQAFTVGERWKVEPHKLDALVNSKKITPEEKARFIQDGAIGSHMENLQRRQGYKGFNEKNVSLIIKETDPRAMSNL